MVTMRRLTPCSSIARAAFTIAAVAVAVAVAVAGTVTVTAGAVIRSAAVSPAALRRLPALSGDRRWRSRVFSGGL
ncbi:hypothetical protein GCM10009733_059610 [Nonomuraea maheshkhaliensis]|uniref:Uncharacterized protein n=1 Tax=Nonomuraea maheshkhaliensis TaxID=419590 RepID=A0ABP4RII7_9ACTN